MNTDLYGNLYLSNLILKQGVEGTITLLAQTFSILDNIDYEAFLKQYNSNPMTMDELNYVNG